MVRGTVVGQLALAVMLFVPGTLHFWQGWAFMAVTLVGSPAFSIYFYRRDRELLARRWIRKEIVGTQKIIMFLMRYYSFAFYVLCGLDHRWGWSQNRFGPVPVWLTVLALLVYAASFFLFASVFTANRFAASVIQTEAGQTVADSGPYRLVRHPMYAVSLGVWLWVPLALGSWAAVPASLPAVPLMVWRLLNEEKILRRDLPGYAEYCRRTRYRLIPMVW